MGKKRPKPHQDPRTAHLNSIDWEAVARRLVREGVIPVTMLDGSDRPEGRPNKSAAPRHN